MEMDAINLSRLVEVAGRGDVEREAGRDAHGHQVLCLCSLIGVLEWMRNANVVHLAAES